MRGSYGMTNGVVLVLVAVNFMRVEPVTAIVTRIGDIVMGSLDDGVRRPSTRIDKPTIAHVGIGHFEHVHNYSGRLVRHGLTHRAS